MTISGNKFTAVLLLSFLFPAPNTAEIKSSMILSDNQSCAVSYPIENSNLQSSYADYYFAMLPSLSSINYLFIFLYFHVLGWWIYACLKINPSFRRIYFLMGVLIVMKLLSLIFVAEDKLTGSLNSSDLLFNIDQSISIFRLLIVILLIGNGYPLVKPCLQGVDKKVLMIVIPLQVFANVASIVMGESGDGKILYGMLNLVDIITAFPVILTFVSSSDGISSKLKTVRFFNVVVTLYLLFNRGLTLIITDIDGHSELNARHAYMFHLKYQLAEEAKSLMLYTASFGIFRQYFECYE